MANELPRRRPGLLLWCVSVSLLGALLAASLLGPLAQVTWGSPETLFWVVTIGAGLCCIGAGWTIAAGWRRGVAEIAILGAALLTQSGLALVHGITAPGVVYGANTSVSTAAFLALPLSLVVAFPLVAPDSAVARQISLRWRRWVAACFAGTIGLAGWLLAEPNALPEARMGQPAVVAVGVASLVVALRISWRQLELYWIGRRAASLVAALAIAYLGLTGLVWIGDRAFNPGWWFVHALDITAVLLACTALVFGYRQDRHMSDLLAPVLAREPLVALRLGLSPVVHRFVADLNTKDDLTRDHVLRVAELAMRAGQRADLPPLRLRWLGLGAMLHDIGKLETPLAILTKPGPLTETETHTMREHAAAGARLLANEADLAPCAPFVEAHHERVDGHGYPRGLQGEQIPFEARLISVCDAFDAMAHTRHYRNGMGAERAIAILNEHAGSQWDEQCVALVAEEIRHGSSRSVLGDVGLSEPVATRTGPDDCVPVELVRASTW